MTAMVAESRDVKGVTVLGSTGSIGVSTLDVIARHPNRFRVTALTANTQVDRLLEQCQRFKPALAVMLDVDSATRLASGIRERGLSTEVRAGMDGLIAAAKHAESEIVMAAIVGAAGLQPALAAVRAGRRVLIANKEPLVMSGHIFIREAARAGAQLLPIDSEHNAVFQCMPGDFRAGAASPAVRRILLTCSGGPFRTLAKEKLTNVTPAQAIAHPRWRMGRKISVDSATLLNKGLEVIEACQLFGVGPDQVEVVIHPQSIVHSMVDYQDGSVLAQLSNPDMRTPIAHALAWPDRIDSGVAPLDIVAMAHLDFEPPDLDRFPGLRLAYTAARQGGTAPAILNAANEVAVEAFLSERIGFIEIARTIEFCLAALPVQQADRLETILTADAAARVSAAEYVDRVSGDTSRRREAR